MRAAALALLPLLLAGCRTGPPASPWAELDADALSVTRLELASGEADRFRSAGPAMRRVVDVLRRAIPMTSDVAPAVSPVRYQLTISGRTDGPRQRWQLELASEDVLAWTDPPDGVRAYFRTPRLRAALEAAREAAGAADPLQQAGARLVTFLARACARAAAAERPLLLVVTATGGRLTVGRQPVTTTAARWPLVDAADASELDALALPDGVALHGAYGTRALRVTADGCAPAEHPDRAGDAIGDPDPGRRQPYPAHYDLVLVERETGRLLLVDLDPASPQPGLRIH